MAQIIPQSGQSFFKHQITETVKRVKGRKQRADAAVQKGVRKEVVEQRDVVCIIGPRLNDPCEGPIAHAHCHSHRRSKTRGQAPEKRHSQKYSFGACAKHHTAYDEKKVQVIATTAAGMNGPYVVRRTRKLKGAA